jgi:hypothetical protein
MDSQALSAPSGPTVATDDAHERNAGLWGPSRLEWPAAESYPVDWQMAQKPESP